MERACQYRFGGTAKAGRALGQDLPLRAKTEISSGTPASIDIVKPPSLLLAQRAS